ncbi:MAG: thioredoxin [Christensenellaceae bacterium]|nr:thioredoxin [Christensenellaceae bacterium]
MNLKNNKAYSTLLDGKLRYIIPIALIVLAAAFIAYGVYDEEILTVFSKATALCRECVGIG